MKRPIAANPRRPTLRLALLTSAAAALLLTGSAGAAKTKHVADKAPNATLGKVVLVNLKHHTLYSLSVEKHGKFICKASCTPIWHPLLVPAGVKPTGPVSLGTVERPEGKTQVTYKGRPLYSFSGDSKAGQANGEGIKDVGTWHAAAVSKIAAPPPAPPENPYPY